MKREVAAGSEKLPDSGGEFPWSMPGDHSDECDHSAGAYTASLPGTGFFADTHDGEKSGFVTGRPGTPGLVFTRLGKTHYNRRQIKWQ